MNILLVDNEPFLCFALGNYLKEIGPGLDPPVPIDVTLAHTLADAVSAICTEAPPSLVFLDLNLNESRGIATLEAFQKHNQEHSQKHNKQAVRVAVFTGLSLTSAADRDILRQCVYELNAWTIVAKTTDLTVMFAGLPRLLTGEAWFSEAVVKALAPAPRKDLGLSPREMDVLRGIERGLRNKEIAQELGLSPFYVQRTTGEIFRKLEVHSRWAAAQKLKENG